MPQWIEFHDSHLLRAKRSPRGVALLLDAYVHQWELEFGAWLGTGWSRPVLLTLGPPASGIDTEDEFDIYNSRLELAGQPISDLVPLPFVDGGDEKLSFDGSGGTVDFAGRGISVEPVGDARFIEYLRWDGPPAPWKT